MIHRAYIQFSLFAVYDLIIRKSSVVEKQILSDN